MRDFKIINADIMKGLTMPKLPKLNRLTIEGNGACQTTIAALIHFGLKPELVAKITGIDIQIVFNFRNAPPPSIKDSPLHLTSDRSRLRRLEQKLEQAQEVIAGFAELAAEKQ